MLNMAINDKLLIMRKLTTLFLALAMPLLSFSQNLPAKKAGVKIPKRFKLPLILEEVSGLYFQAPNKFWWHNDSGAQPKLYQTDKKGKLTQTIFLENIQNRDWEDLTHDDEGNIYIGDFGNNKNARRDLKIYIYHPEKETLDSIAFTYPDQKLFPPPSPQCNFDMEGFFWHKGQLHLFSKNRLGVGDYFTKHYTLDAKPGSQEAVLKDKIFLKGRVVTAAAISPDGKTVALLSYLYKRRKPIPKSKASVFFFRDFEGTDFFKGKMNKMKVPSFIFSTQYESLDFLDNENILIASERTKFIRQKAKRLKVK